MVWVALTPQFLNRDGNQKKLTLFRILGYLNSKGRSPGHDWKQREKKLDNDAGDAGDDNGNDAGDDHGDDGDDHGDDGDDNGNDNGDDHGDDGGDGDDHIDGGDDHGDYSDNMVMTMVMMVMTMVTTIVMTMMIKARTYCMPGSVLSDICISDLFSICPVWGNF